MHGVDLSRPVSDAAFGKIAEAWAEHLVLRFSGQKIDDPTLMKFSARFGELDRVPIAAAELRPHRIPAWSRKPRNGWR